MVPREGHWHCGHVRSGRKLLLLLGLIACISFAYLQGVSQKLVTFVTARAVLIDRLEVKQ